MSDLQTVPITSDLDDGDLYLNIVLRDVKNDEAFPVRHFPVGLSWSFKIGRGSQNDDNLNPRPHNSWFGSRVMSREHAEILVDHVTREISIIDLKSMHGTYMYGRRLHAGEKTKLYPHDVVTFGTDVVRGEHTYRPLHLQFEFEWSDGIEQPGFSIDRYRNTNKPNYVEDIIRFDDDEVEVVGSSSVNHISTQSQLKPRTFSVPDSDDSDNDSDEDDKERSSPVTLDDDITEEIVEVDPSKVDSFFNDSTRNALDSHEPSQQIQSPIVIVDEEPTRPAHHGGYIRLPREGEVRDAINEASTVFDDIPEDEDDQDFDSEAADLHMQASDEDNDYSVMEDNSDIVEENLDDLEDFEPKEDVQIPEFLRTAFEASVQTQYTSQSNDSINVTLPPINRVVDTSHVPAPQNSVWPTTDEKLVTAELVQETASSLPRGTGRVSIHNIINSPDYPTEPQLKRKADEMIGPESEQVESGVPPASEILPTRLVTDRNDVKTENESEEPPRKLIKLEIHAPSGPSRRKTVLRYTATAVAGAAVGAVAAVFGLAALPADYFI